MVEVEVEITVILRLIDIEELLVIVIMVKMVDVDLKEVIEGVEVEVDIEPNEQRKLTVITDEMVVVDITVI